MSSGAARRDELLAALDAQGRQLGSRHALFTHAIADRMGIDASAWECLDILDWTGSTTAGRLAELTGLTTGAITGVLDRLERAGYVKRERDALDRRKVMVHLVPHKKLTAMFEPLAETFSALVEPYSEAELSAILDYVRRVNELLDAETARIRAESSGAISATIKAEIRRAKEAAKAAKADVKAEVKAASQAIKAEVKAAIKGGGQGRS